MTSKEFDERLDEVLKRLLRAPTTAYIDVCKDRIINPFDDADTRVAILNRFEDIQKEAKQSLRQLFKDAVGEDRKEDDTNCAWGHDFAASIVNERNAELREIIEE